MFDVPGYRVVRTLGAVYGITVRSRNWGAALTMVVKSVAGGDLRWFTDMLYRCRNDAISRIVRVGTTVADVDSRASARGRERDAFFALRCWFR